MSSLDRALINFADDNHWRMFRAMADDLRRKGATAEVSITTPRDPRSTGQNRILHLFIGRLAVLATQAYGGDGVWDLDRMKRHLKAELLPRRPGPLGDEIPSTSDLSVGECCRFIEAIIDFGIKYFDEDVSVYEPRWRKELETVPA